MADEIQQDKKADSKISDLPNKAVTPDKAGQVKGGVMGGDDDLEDLEVERLGRR
jgi:hypothetical protein